MIFLEKRPYLVRLLKDSKYRSENEWDPIVNIAQTHNVDLHWENMYTICGDVIDDDCIFRGYDLEHGWYTYPKFTWDKRFGFRPVLVPLDIATLEPDMEYLSTIKDGSIIKKFRLTMNGHRVPIPSDATWCGDICPFKPNAILDFSDSENAISWMKYSEGFIADRNLLSEISWNSLHKQGFC